MKTRSIIAKWHRAPASNPVAQVIVALLLLAPSLGALALVAYADQYVNGGVAWGPDRPPVDHTAGSPLGVNVFLEKEADPAKIDKTLQMARDGGFKWVRQGFPWNDIEIAGKGDFADRRGPEWVDSWAKYDRIVDACRRYGLEIIARLDTPPDWARMPGDDIQTYRKGPPANYQDYGDFVYNVVSRYKGKIKYFQIWNEPNLIGEWGGHPISPEEYTRLLKVGYEAAKRANPDAVVITAALAPTAEQSIRNLNDVLFLEGMYRAGAGKYFDILSTMLYGLGQPPDERRTDLNRLNFSRPILLRRVMEKYGDAHKPIWISEYAWISLPPDFKGDTSKNIWGKSVDEETQGRWLVEGYERAMGEWPWMGVMSVWHLRMPDPVPDEPANYFAILHDDFSARPAYNAIKAYANRPPDSFRVSLEKPTWNAWGFPVLYGMFGLLAIAVVAYGASGLGRWAEAALDRPRGRYSEAARETARNGAAVVSMALLLGLYYRANSPPLVLGALGGLWLLAFLKPSTGLAAVAFTIPLFWHPKEIRQQHFIIAETLIFLVFGALMARRIFAYLLPGPAARLHMEEALIARAAIRPEQNGNGPAKEPAIPPPRALSSPTAGEADDLTPADWPTRPVTEPLATNQALVATVQKAAQAAGVSANGHTEQGPPQSATHPDPVAPYSDTQQGPCFTFHVSRFTSYVSRFRAWNREDAFAPPAVALLIVGTLSLFTLADPTYATDSARAYRWVIVEPVLLYFLLTDAVGTRRGLWRVADFFVAAAVGVALLGIWQYLASEGTLIVQGVSRVSSVYQHPNNLALYLGRALPFAACAGIFMPVGWRKALYLLACVPIGITTVLTYSRGAWVAVTLAVALAVAAGLYWRPGRARPRRSAWILAAGAVALVLGLALIAAPTVVPRLPPRIFNVGSSLLRLSIWESSLRMLADHPVFGVGPDQFLNQFQAHYITPDLQQESFTAHPHNLILDYWLSLGIMGLLILVWLLWRYFREAISAVRSLARGPGPGPGRDPANWAYRALALGLLAGMLDFLLHGLVDNSYFLMDLALIFWLSCGLMQMVRET